MEELIIDTVNNKTELNELIKTKIDFNDLFASADTNITSDTITTNEEEGKTLSKKQSIDFVHDNLTLECVRNNDGRYYSIHMDSNGDLLFVFYDSDFKEVELELCYHDSCNDFSKNIIAGKTTIKDITKYDKNVFVQNTNSNGLCSIHRCKNGTDILITYHSTDGKYSDENLVVKRIESSNFLTERILPIDADYLEKW
jgi:hypothetical protein